MTGQELSRAWNAWIESKAGQTCLDVESIKAPKESMQYIKNRLWHAFMAGVKAVCEHHPETKT